MSLSHIGTQPLETERLVLRKVRLSDAEQIYNNWAKDPENVKYVGWSAHKNVEETRQVIAQWINSYNKPDYYRWMIILKSNGQVIGGIDVVKLSSKDEWCEIGYILSKKHWNSGFMTEALHIVLKYLFKNVGFHRIQAEHLIDNPASGRVMEKNGFKFEGIIRHPRRNNSGSWCDTRLYSILQDEYI